MKKQEYEFWERGLRREICHGLDSPYVCWTPIWRRIETCMANKSIRESFLREIWSLFPSTAYVIAYYGRENFSEDFIREMNI